ncbi:hypothetical protein [Flavobacterium sp. SM2513]|uniref:hypothetical protein n=1 Tax=Flavobacterium sp. SM2513 TaxID=3424766 RepID=UPI003D7F3A2A
MKKHIVVFAFLSICNSVIGQTMEKEDLYGIWQVEKNLTETTDPNFKELIEGFLVSTFRFEENGTFEMNSPNKSKLFLMTLEMIKNKKWKFDHYRQLIKIGSEKDSFSIMGIFVKEKSGKIIFQVSESNLEFEMVKI